MTESDSHRTNGLYRLLEIPVVYQAFQSVLGAHGARQEVVARYLRPRPGLRVLDVGCGPADLLGYLPEDIEYTGIDINSGYIERARKRWGNRGVFLVGQAADVQELDLRGPFDRVVLWALLHHLEDREALSLLDAVVKLCAPSGFLFTFDNVKVRGQSRVARYLIDHDRGARVRTPEAYLALLGSRFPAISWEVREDLIRVPYTHFIACAAAGPNALER